MRPKWCYLSTVLTSEVSHDSQGYNIYFIFGCRKYYLETSALYLLKNCIICWLFDASHILYANFKTSFRLFMPVFNSHVSWNSWLFVGVSFVCNCLFIVSMLCTCLHYWVVNQNNCFLYINAYSVQCVCHLELVVLVYYQLPLTFPSWVPWQQYQILLER